MGIDWDGSYARGEAAGPGTARPGTGQIYGKRPGKRKSASLDTICSPLRDRPDLPDPANLLKKNPRSEIKESPHRPDPKGKRFKGLLGLGCLIYRHRHR